MKRGTKRKVEEIAEDWCFFCKDGGQLMICEYKGCLKAYHPQCVGKDDSFLETSVRWHCNWHRCFICHKASKFQCFFCPRAVCGRCVNDADFPIVKGAKGYCHHCLKLALLIEDMNDVDSDGALVDFEDRDTYEYLFMEYYNFLKEKEGLDTHHINIAKNLRKKGNSNRCDSDSFESGQEKPGGSGWNSDLVDSDYDDINDAPYSKPKKNRKGCTGKLKSMNIKVKGLVDSDYNDISDTSYYKSDRSGKGYIKKAKLMNAKVKYKKMEFDGWGSAILIKFLHHAGKSTSEELSQDDVTSTIIKYCQENNLFDPDKKKKVICDSWLYSLFRRKYVNRNSMYNLLSVHFAENIEQIIEDDSISEETNMEAKVILSCKTERRVGIYGKPNEEPEPNVHESHLAAIVSQNIKHVYLKKSLMEELAGDPETFSEKVIGSFVRVKSDPNDYLQKNSHLLLPVTGVTVSCNGDTDKEFILQFSNPPRSEPVCKISDADFSEEECEDLHHRMKNGPLKQPTIVELERKARSLHMDITKHRITSELALLQRLIDRANEKGWRRELSEYLDRKMLLETPKEQTRLLAEVPKVIADKIEPPILENCLTIDEQKEKLPFVSALGETHENNKDYSQGNNSTCYHDYGKDTTAKEVPVLEDKDNVPLSEVPSFSSQSSAASKPNKLSNLLSPSSNHFDSSPRSEHHCFPELKQRDSKPLNLPSPSSPSNKQTKLSNPSLPTVVDINSSLREEHHRVPQHQHLNHSKALGSHDCTVKEPSSLVEAKQLQSDLDTKGKSSCPTINIEEIIKKSKLSENGTLGKVADIETPIWFAVGPNGERRGPVSTSLLKRWGEAIPYAAQFKVWKTNQSENEAIFLLEAVSQNYPNV